MSARRLSSLSLVIVALGLIALWRFRSPVENAPVVPSKSAPTPVAADFNSKPKTQNPKPATPVSPPPSLEPPGILAADLNLPGGTINRDLQMLNDVFNDWRVDFPGIGNPVGDNVDITRAFTGENSLHFAFIGRDHRAINSEGELCDRWGTPFRFHALSGTRMEIRSAGPDRKFGTADDALLTPP